MHSKTLLRILDWYAALGFSNALWHFFATGCLIRSVRCQHCAEHKPGMANGLAHLSNMVVNAKL